MKQGGILVHLQVCPIEPRPCIQEDLTMANQKVLDMTRYWATENIYLTFIYYFVHLVILLLQLV